MCPAPGFVDIELRIGNIHATLYGGRQQDALETHGSASAGQQTPPP